ncbi:hypothetical protein D6D15_03678 [Aureobasidium pullulans]|uniref:Uncharacterized protein n=1 Tax=Aureobasidium pullulans TaxID=5580 RepID=A0A4S9BEL9_AURPU|nr:hypothetical protein D6D15_03678 [Aureobasidium pullulans]
MFVRSRLAAELQYRTNKYKTKEKIYLLLKDVFQGTRKDASQQEIQEKLKKVQGNPDLDALESLYPKISIFRNAALLARKGLFEVDEKKNLTYLDATGAARAEAPLVRRANDTTINHDPWTTSTYDGMYHAVKQNFRGTPRNETKQAFVEKLANLMAASQEVRELKELYGFERLCANLRQMIRAGLFLVDYDLHPSREQAIVAASKISGERVTTTEAIREGSEHDLNLPLNDHLKSSKHASSKLRGLISFKPSDESKDNLPSSLSAHHNEHSTAVEVDNEEIEENNHLVEEIAPPTTLPWSIVRLPNMNEVEPSKNRNLVPGPNRLRMFEAQQTFMALDDDMNECMSMAISSTGIPALPTSPTLENRMDEQKDPSISKPSTSEPTRLPALQELGLGSGLGQELNLSGLRPDGLELEDTPSFLHILEPVENKHANANKNSQASVTLEDAVSPTDLWTYISESKEVSEDAPDAPDALQLSSQNNFLAQTESTIDQTAPLPKMNLIRIGTDSSLATWRYKPVEPIKMRYKSPETDMKSATESGPDTQSKPDTDSKPEKIEDQKRSTQIDELGMIDLDEHEATIPKAESAEVADDPQETCSEQQKERKSLLREAEESLRKADRPNPKARDGPRAKDMVKNKVPEEISQYATMPVPETYDLYLPYRVQYKLLTYLQASLETVCFGYLKREHSHTLEGSDLLREVEYPENLELPQYINIFREHVEFDSQALNKYLDKPVKHLYNSLVWLRHYTVHRIQINIGYLYVWVNDARSLAKLVGDSKAAEQFETTQFKLERLLAGLKRRRVKYEDKLLATVKELAAKRAELDRLEKEAMETYVKDVKRSRTRAENSLSVKLEDLVPEPEKAQDVSSPEPASGGILSGLKSLVGA